jgi:uncharacterized membrane protein
VTWRTFFAALIAGFLTGAALPYAGLPFSTNSIFDILSRLITTGVPFIGLYLFLICVFHGSTQPIRQFIRILQEMMPLSVSKRLSP